MWLQFMTRIPLAISSNNLSIRSDITSTFLSSLTSLFFFSLFLSFFNQKCTYRLSILSIRMSTLLQSAFLSANRGPLTKLFTPPSSCLSETTLVSYLTTISSLTTSYTTTKIFINHYSWGDGACYPSTIATISGSTRWNNGYYYCRSRGDKGSKELTD
jgi:hypothetical protein